MSLDKEEESDAYTTDGPTVGRGSRKASVVATEGTTLVVRYAFGVSGPVRDNVGFVLAEDSSLEGEDHGAEYLVHPVGQQLAMYRMDDGSMQFFTGRAKNVKEIVALAISPNKRAVAVCERTDDAAAAQVSIYSVATAKRVRTLTHALRGEFTSCAFNTSSKLLAAVGGEAEAQLVVWAWEKGKVVRAGGAGGGAHHGPRVTRLHFSPDDDARLTTSGPQHLRIWYTMPDGAQKVHSLLPSGREFDALADHTWLRSSSGSSGGGTGGGGGGGGDNTAAPGGSGGGGGGGGTAARMVAATDGEGVRDTRGASILVFDAIAAHPFLELRQMIQAHLPGSSRLETVVPCAKGFLAAGGGVASGFLSVYEATADRRAPYALVRALPTRAGALTALAVSRGGETAVAYARAGRLLALPLASVDALDESADHFVSLLPGGTHCGAVVAADVAVHKPLLATVGADRRLRVWNYLRWRCDIVHELRVEDPACVALHPSGYLVAVGFKASDDARRRRLPERIRLYHVLAAGLRPDRELSAKNVRALRFSRGGHLLAAAAGFSVCVFAA
ncbi:WD40-repeat-containing domain protein, partial [Tribonema minus]